REAKEAQSKEKGKTQSGSLVRPFSGGHMPPNESIVPAPQRKSPSFFSFSDFFSPLRTLSSCWLKQHAQAAASNARSGRERACSSREGQRAVRADRLLQPGALVT